MDEEQARQFVARNTKAVLATIKRDGRPQLSNISYSLDDDGLIKISVTADRAKTRNILRDPRVSLAIQGANWGEYLVVEGTCEVRDRGEETLAELRHIYERITGKPHPDWQEFNRAMVRDKRVILAISIERLYPLGR
jgi:PPOX class probable F420-dependent enzyme